MIAIKFNKYGVKYGWAGNQAALWIDTKAITSEEEYSEFLKELNDLPVPEQYKRELKETTKIITPVTAGKPNLANQIASLSVNAFLTVEDMLRDKTQVKNQMFFYGIIKLYFNDLEKYMNS